ncbi:nitrilase-related carbon-nitrogen hydrolase [Saccharopolyspora pogona]|uniref:nitrilase-related carbon-nitrogen hydrolase n=1 Tax=Saccharopolyspora pogona TaxID=333966 RepID=UPI001685DB84|nr:nitrilase-related carbon-nitrogen hydrolase [Saccharopolyspora pogona]
MTTLTVAAVQFELRAEPTLEGFAAHLSELLDKAVSAGAELVVFPELVTTGLLASVPGEPVHTRTVGKHYRTVFPAVTDDLVELLRELARSREVTILGGSHYRFAADGSLRNTAILAHPDSRIEMQDKLHLTPPEHELGAVGGDDVLISRIGPFTAAIQICADIEFPEVPRYLTEQGVDLILTPSLTWNRRGANRVRYGAHARAMENQLYVVTTPLVGTSGLPKDAPLHGTGAALVAGPIDRATGANDGALARGSGSIEEIVTVTLDRAALSTSRAKPEVPGLSLRRPELYERLRGVPPTARWSNATKSTSG